MPDQKPGFPRPVTIICQSCGEHCAAEVKHFVGDPWMTLIHECEHCAYINMESEWCEVTHA